MARPPISDEQRVMAVALLANAIRRTDRPGSQPGTFFVETPAPGSRRRRDPSQEYLRGMRDLLAVLFDGGPRIADDCYASAQTQATGDPPPP